MILLHSALPPMKGSAFVAHNFNFRACDYFVSLTLYTAPLYANYIFYVSVCRLNIKKKKKGKKTKPQPKQKNLCEKPSQKLKNFI